uniref:Myosin light chain kinase, smooth muscle n=1 Tax=Amazona collaria TaxID=241587 RepID=A0A8B9J344_9PSIT
MGDVKLVTSTRVSKTSLTLSPPVPVEAPAFTLPPRNIRVQLGATARFEGKVGGYPEPQITWYRNGHPVAEGDHYIVDHSIRGIFSLVIKGVQEGDGGKYTCEAANDGGVRQVTVELTVEGKRILTLGRLTVPSVEHRPSIWGESPPKFATKPNRVVVREGQTGKFSCKITGRPQPQVTWFKGDLQLQQNERFNMFEKTGIQFLEIQNAQLADSGIYTCTVVNSAGKASVSAELTVQGTAKSLQERKQHSLKQTFFKISLAVEVKDSKQGQHQEANAVSSQEPKEGRNGSQVLQKTSSTITLQAVKLQPEPKAEPQATFVRQGEDRKRAVQSLMSAQQTPSLTGQVSPRSREAENRSAAWKAVMEEKREPLGIPPQFVNRPQSLEASEGQEIKFMSRVSGKPKPDVEWFREGETIKAGQNVQIYEEDGIHCLWLKKACLGDSGSYSCTAFSPKGQTSTSWLLTVRKKKSSKNRESAQAAKLNKAFAPIFHKGLTDLKVMDGSQVIMTVEVSANPPPEIIWLHNGKEIQETEDFHFEKKGNEYSLYIQEVFPEDTGKYTCEAWNELGETQTQATLTVQEPQDGIQPWFISKPRSVTAAPGQNVLISCAIAGDPFPTVRWFKDGQEIMPGTACEILQNEDIFTLVLRSVQSHHAGQYEIQLRNQVGECSCQVSLMLRESSASPAEIGRESASSGERRDGGDHGKLTFGRTSGFKKISSETRGAEAEQEDVRGVLKRRVETREHTEESLRQQEAEQLDFRDILGKKVSTKSFSEEELKEIPAEQMDFRANLQRQVKPKTLSEEERKVHAPQQVDFRSVLAKKGTPKTPLPEKAPPPKPAVTDFRSVLGSKKKPPAENGSANTPAANAHTNSGAQNATPNSQAPVAKPAVKKEEKNDRNCEHGCAVVDGRITGKKAENKAPASKPPASKGTAPSFTEKLQDAQVVDGEKLVLQCRISSDPPAAVTWTVDSKTIKSSKSIVISQEGTLCSLTIEKAMPEDRGEYKCIAENAAGKAECACKVLVEGEATVKKKPAPKTPPKAAAPPQITQFPEDRKVRAGESVELFAKVVGTAPITCTWMKFRKQIEENEYIKIENAENTSKLTISSTKQEHCGCYTLVVENKLGSRQAQVNLTVVDKPDPPAGTPCASDIRSSSLTLSWYGSSYDGGSAVQSYTVEIWNSVDNKWTDLTTCRSTSFNVQDLQADREYKFRVRAANVYGISEPSQESELVKVGEKQEELKEDEVELSDDEGKETEVEYRTVTINTEQKVSDVYNIEERLGSGKFGQVFRLVEKKTGKVWAGKFFKAYSAKEKENIRDEISIMNCLHHPKLVQCVDAFEEKANIVMVLEISAEQQRCHVQSKFAPLITFKFILFVLCLSVYSVPRVSGLSPFMGDNDNETLANVTSATWDFDDEAFDEISDDAKDFISNLLKKDMKSRLNCTQCLQHPWLQKDTKTMEAKKLSKDRMKKYMARRKWQKTGHAVRAIGRLSSMAMISGMSGRKASGSSPTSPINADKVENEDAFLEEVAEEKPHVKPYFTKTILDMEVVEGSAARFDCKIEGYPDPEVMWYKDDQPVKESRHFQIDYDEDGNCSLTISEVCGDDDAKYTCKAVNSLGEATCTAELLVETMAKEGEDEDEEEEE